MSNLQSVSEVRTQIYLSEDLHKAVKKLAKQRGVSMAQIIREAIEEKVPVKSGKDEKEWNELMKFAGFAKGGSKDDSIRTGELWGELIYKNMVKNRRKK